MSNQSLKSGKKKNKLYSLSSIITSPIRHIPFFCLLSRASVKY